MASETSIASAPTTLCVAPVLERDERSGPGLTHGVATALAAGTGMLALALVLVVALIVRPGQRRTAAAWARS